MTVSVKTGLRFSYDLLQIGPQVCVHLVQVTSSVRCVLCIRWQNWTESNSQLCSSNHFSSLLYSPCCCATEL